MIILSLTRFVSRATGCNKQHLRNISKTHLLKDVRRVAIFKIPYLQREKD